ncbi:MAG: hypothetical protein JSU87_15875 [Gemmatimonadota bacterium]|nr:MAG: hypothetical protein JSU87_15875 [Gemmatimonadota bacterium]
MEWFNLGIARPPSTSYTRYLVDGQTVQYVFTAIVADSAGVVLRPYSGGIRSVDDFRLAESSDKRAVFENPEHDYPKRITYRLDRGGSLVARIDGGAEPDWGLSPPATGRLVRLGAFSARS